ncbi:beta-galactosidase [Fulvitalea axinellae]|uniref:Beta-galactosidase n=1 Tax=Fulvitalea axinellae TaxID=1182444 RepID=A0AAU9CCS5_9BACT|nr:beta-galactosidase [Fulvitalea axinellae]
MTKAVRFTLRLCFALTFYAISAYGQSQSAPGLPINFDHGWKFILDDIAEAKSSDYNDKKWRSLDLPHDWSVEGEYSNGPNTEWRTGYLPAGVGWYRKTFKTNKSWKDKHVAILFDGVYMNSEVWINGHYLGKRPYGYIGFEYDLTPYLRSGKNVIAVRVDRSDSYSDRWYPGSGIYRHVWLNVKSPAHIKTWGVYFRHQPTENNTAKVKATYDIVNKSDKPKNISVKTVLKNPDGKTVAQSTDIFKIGPEEEKPFDFDSEVKNPQRWSPENPNLYTLKVFLSENGKTTDYAERKVGIRDISFSPKDGFRLNGQRLKIKGVCTHHDAGPVGAAVPEDVWLRRLKLLKSMGCNAVRTAHNPFAPEFYRMCDELGLMVMDESFDGWERNKTRAGYGNFFEEWAVRDLSDFIRRDRSHPSVIIWSIGNEVPGATLKTQKMLVDICHNLDPTRPVTQGGHSPSRKETTNLNTQGHLDIKGFNGSAEHRNTLEDYHARHPKVPMIGTELPHTYQTRGVYRSNTHYRRQHFPAMWEQTRTYGGKPLDEDFKKRIFLKDDLASEEFFPEETQTHYYQDGNSIPIPNNKPFAKHLYYQSSYDNAFVRCSARESWNRTERFDFMLGEFRWGSFDYLGETNEWPSRFANFGVIDICGFPKDAFYLYQSMWTDKPMVHLLPHWTHPGKEGKAVPVVAYTNCDSVSLSLNGKSLGTKAYKKNDLKWLVPYKKGTLTATAYRQGKAVATDSVRTADQAKKIRLTADKTETLADGRSVIHYTIDITDERGTLCPMASNEVTFDIKGPARLIGVDNGDPLDLSRYKVPRRRAFRGKCLLMVQSTGRKGKIVVEASSDGLESGMVIVFAK